MPFFSVSNKDAWVITGIYKEITIHHKDNHTNCLSLINQSMNHVWAVKPYKLTASLAQLPDIRVFVHPILKLAQSRYKDNICWQTMPMIHHPTESMLSDRFFTSTSSTGDPLADYLSRTSNAVSNYYLSIQLFAVALIWFENWGVLTSRPFPSLHFTLPSPSTFSPPFSFPSPQRSDPLQSS
jgi:hypothetical protein